MYALLEPLLNTPESGMSLPSAFWNGYCLSDLSSKLRSCCPALREHWFHSCSQQRFAGLGKRLTAPSHWYGVDIPEITSGRLFQHAPQHVLEASDSITICGNPMSIGLPLLVSKLLIHHFKSVILCSSKVTFDSYEWWRRSPIHCAWRPR